ncbi:hypothetical protein T458_00055 [Brevibacillus panacihumi W25]|uniref:Integrase catalytic domain-containing protein n=1 Tax=Brevibacillus panacihumi W25 TaxID=1408254 RepID=V6MBZ4_9BACL|nr:hypothetical protein [Brevibacillus panacihumi]EST55777.1 hypothetical protein T458_00055 [Brevibacillus panacihumi W25]
MPRRKMIERPSADIDISKWPIVNIESLSENEQVKFQKRKEAVNLYINDKATLEQIKQLTGIAPIDVRRFTSRCLLYDENGNLFGYRALIPQVKIKPYKRILPLPNMDESKSIFTGAFTKLLNEYPTIKEAIDDLYLKRNKRKVHEPRIRIKDLHRKFLHACKAAGIAETEYPFNTVSMGKRALERYIKTLHNQHFNEASAKRFGEEAGRRARNSLHFNPDKRIITRPFEQVQFDGHRIDAIFTITFTTPSGNVVTDVIDRPWLLTVIDVATRVILGYHLCLKPEYDRSDVLICSRNAVVPWKRKELTIDGLTYPEGIGFASEVIPATKWALWDEILFDNAKSHLANMVKDRLKNVIKCDVNLGPVKMPERRGLIERFYGLLETNGYQRLPNTTGNNPKDIRRNKPEVAAKKYNISIGDLEELTEILIATYNLSPHSGVDYLSPLQSMEQKISRGEVLRIMPIEEQSEISFLTLEAKRNVVGNAKYGKRPHIEYEGVTYHNEILSRSPDLVGTKLTIFVNIEDLRFVRAFLPCGSELGILTAKGKWGVTPHSLKTRKAINQLKREKVITIMSMDDPIDIFLRYLEKRGVNDKRSRTKLGHLQYQNKEHALKQENVPAEPSVIVSDLDKQLEQNGGPEQITRKLRRTIVY